MSDQYPYQIKENVGSTNQAGNSGNTGTTGYTPNYAAQNQGVPNQSSNNNLAKTILIIVAVLVLIYIGIKAVGFIVYQHEAQRIQQEYQQNVRDMNKQFEENVRRTQQEYQKNTEEMRKQHEEDVQRMKDQYYGNSK